MTNTKYYSRLLDRSEYPVWQDFNESADNGSVYSNPAYLDALSTATDAAFRVVGVFKGSDIHGGITLYERRVRGTAYVSPRPLLTYSGIVIRRFDTGCPSHAYSRIAAILGEIDAYVRRQRYWRVKIRALGVDDVRPFVHVGGWSAMPEYTYVVDLTDIAVAWKRMDQNARRLVRRGEKSGLSISINDDLETFVEMHVDTAGRKGSDVYLRKDTFVTFLRTIVSEGLARLYHARLPDGRSIAGQLVLLGKHEMSHTVCAASEAEHVNLGSNYFLRWRVFEDLASLGYASNDLTGGRLDDVGRFKAQLGAELRSCCFLTWPPESASRRAEIVRKVRLLVAR